MGWSQTELALAASCSRATVARCEHGFAPSLSVAISLASALSIPVESIFGGKVDDTLRVTHRAPTADELRDMLIANDLPVVILSFPSLEVTRRAGFSRAQHDEWRTQWLMDVNQAVNDLRAEDEELDISTRESTSEAIEFTLVIVSTTEVDEDESEDDADA